MYALNNSLIITAVCVICLFIYLYCCNSYYCYVSSSDRLCEPRWQCNFVNLIIYLCYDALNTCCYIDYNSNNVSCFHLIIIDLVLSI